MKLNRTRELWRATSPSGRWYYEIERQASQDLESLFQENFELRDAVESYKIAELETQLEQYKKARGPVISRELYEKMMKRGDE